MIFTKIFTFNLNHMNRMYSKQKIIMVEIDKSRSGQRVTFYLVRRENGAGDDIVGVKIQRLELEKEVSHSAVPVFLFQ